MTFPCSPSESVFEASDLIYVMVSCLAAVGISVSAFNVQQCVSPTAFITLNNMSKVPALILSYWLFETVMTSGNSIVIHHPLRQMVLAQLVFLCSAT